MGKKEGEQRIPFESRPANDVRGGGKDLPAKIPVRKDEVERGVWN